MRLGAMLGPEPDQHDFAPSRLSRDHGRLTSQSVSADQPAALEDVRVGVSGDHLVTLVELTRDDLENGAVEEKLRIPTNLATCSGNLSTHRSEATLGR